MEKWNLSFEARNAQLATGYSLKIIRSGSLVPLIMWKSAHKRYITGESQTCKIFEQSILNYVSRTMFWI